MRTKNDVVVYAEGASSGPNSVRSQIEYRQAFSNFFAKTVLGKTHRPRLVPCGGRGKAFEAFRTAISQGTNALLLVDSEDPVHPAHASPPEGNWEPWTHLKQRDNWEKPKNATDDDCHLMVQCMESWFLADWPAVKSFFGHGFAASGLPKGTVESILKDDVYNTLQKATQNCKTKAPYGKGLHSFKLLALIDPTKVMAASPWAKRFIDELAKRKP